MTATEMTLAPRGTLFGALAKAQAKIRHAAKDSKNPHFNSRYADLASVAEACREALTENGICVIQDPATVGNQVVCTTTLGHASGELYTSQPLAMTPRDLSPQSVGSCVTYLRRYQLASVVGVAPDDDDGNAAQGSADPKAGKAPPAPRANTVKHTGAKASAEAVKMLHTLRGKVGGLTVCTPKDPCPYKNGTKCGYHAQLAAFKDSDGNPVTTSKDLSPDQIANLIGRYEKRIAEQEQRAAEQPDLGALGRNGASNNNALEAAIKDKGIDVIDLQEYILAPFGADTVAELEPDDKPKALALVLAFVQGAEPYRAVLSKLGFPDGVMP